MLIRLSTWEASGLILGDSGTVPADSKRTRAFHTIAAIRPESAGIIGSNAMNNFRSNLFTQD